MKVKLYFKLFKTLCEHLKINFNVFIQCGSQDGDIDQLVNWTIGLIEISWSPENESYDFSEPLPLAPPAQIFPHLLDGLVHSWFKDILHPQTAQIYLAMN